MTVAVATNPEDPITLEHLKVLSSDAQWGRASLGSRICGVTHDTPDAGFAAKSCLPDGFHVVEDAKGLASFPEEDPDPAPDQTLRIAGVIETDQPRHRRPRPESPAEFLSRIDIPALCAGWNRTDRWTRRAVRARNRSSTRSVRRRFKRRVAQLERWRHNVEPSSSPVQLHFWSRWGQVMDELDRFKTRGGSDPSWVRELRKRLLAIGNPSPKAAARTLPNHPVSGSPGRRKHPQKSRKTSRQSVKPTRTPAFG